MRANISWDDLTDMAKAEIGMNVRDILCNAKDKYTEQDSRKNLVLRYILHSRSHDDQGIEGSLKITIGGDYRGDLEVIIEGSYAHKQTAFEKAVPSDFSPETKGKIMEEVKKALEDEMKRHQKEASKIQRWLEKL